MDDAGSVRGRKSIRNLRSDIQNFCDLHGSASHVVAQSFSVNELRRNEVT